ncbi:uncharacterized protein LOC135684331 [Rhopilema esculentum]|uniref:uncharacterized protein LOC135684331 n=1 Tax=Rhopilema esculentum TaxID=499914 RepID=UPI0031CF65CD|eukprot:gene16509-7929_t
MVKTVKKKQKFTKSNFRVESYEPTRDFVDSSPTEEHYGVAYDVDDLPKIAMVHTLDRPVQPTSKRSTVIEIYPGGIFQPGVVVSSNATSSFDIGMSGDGVTAQSQDLFQEQEPNDCEDNFGELDRNNEGGKFLPSHNAMNMSRIKSRKNLRIQMKKDFLTSDLQSMRKASAKYGDSTVYSTSYKTNRLTRPKDCHRRKSWSYVYQRNTFAKDRHGDEMSEKNRNLYTNDKYQSKKFTFGDGFKVKKEIENDTMSYSKFSHADISDHFEDENISFDFQNTDHIQMKEAHEM